MGIILLVFVILAAGCETAKGAGKGIAYGVGAAAKGVAKDSHDFWNFIQSTDSWIKNNLW